MRAEYKFLRAYTAMALLAPGAFMELGVWRGDTFRGMALDALAAGRECHGVDSFKGMAEPTEIDRLPDGRHQYPKGALAAPRRLVEAKVKGMTHVRLHEGFIPAILELVKVDAVSFAHVDLDQYQPTLDALVWLWPRMSARGCVAVHDYFPGRGVLSTPAVDKFCRLTPGAVVACVTNNNHAILWKP